MNGYFWESRSVLGPMNSSPSRQTCSARIAAMGLNRSTWNRRFSSYGRSFEQGMIQVIVRSQPIAFAAAANRGNDSKSDRHFDSSPRQSVGNPQPAGFRPADENM